MKRILSIILLSTLLQTNLYSQSIWSDSLILTPEKSEFQKTSTYKDVIHFLDEIKKVSDKIYIFSMGKSLEGKDIPVAVLANPMVKTEAEAKASGKAVIYIQGNIHAGEVEGKEAVMMLMRDILLGDKKHLLDNLIILFVPIYNTDANDKMAKGLRPSQEDSPIETGERESSEGYDLNRDGVKMDALETRGLFENVIVPWDPQIFVDLHTTNGTWHAYPLTWAPSYHSVGEYAPFDYTYNKMLPSITNAVYQKHNLQFGVYGDYELSEGWPPKNFYTYNHHPRYLVNQFGFRNRMAILSETFAHNRFYERMNSTYVFISEILEYANINSKEIIEINNHAETSTIKDVITNAGKIKKGVQFKIVPLNKLNNFITYDYLAVPDTNGKKKYYRSGKIVKYDSINYYAKFEATLESTLPRGYIIPEGFPQLIENLIRHGIKVEQLQKSQTFHGESFMIDSLVNAQKSFQKHKSATLYGSFKTESRKYKKGDYIVDMAQPLSNLIFYLLEPQSDDGLVHWNFLDDYILNSLLDNVKVRYPVFKYYN
ncbi:MAG: M14 family metallopeptidase [Bacteroidia bacterium]